VRRRRSWQSHKEEEVIKWSLIKFLKQ